MEKLYVEAYKGKYRYVYRYPDPLTGKVKRITCVKDKNTPQAYNQALKELQDKVICKNTDHYTLDDARKMYIKDKAKRTKPQTVQKNETIVRIVNSYIGEDVFIDKLNASMVREALYDCCEHNYTFNEKLCRYKVFLRWCFQNDLIENDWTGKLKPLPDNRKERIEDKYLEPEELKALLAEMKSENWYYVTYFLALSGLRIGELIALEDSDIDETYIHVNKTYSLVTHKVNDTKTRESTRDVFMQKDLRALVKKIRSYEMEYRFKYGIRSKLFICSRDGNYILYESYRKYLRNLSIKVLGRYVTPHALRHTSASLLLAEGIPLETISRRLGHSDSQITKDIYIHLTSKLRKMDESLLEKVSIL